MNLRKLSYCLILFGVILSSCDKKEKIQTEGGSIFPSIDANKVGISSEKLSFLKDEISSWVETGDLVGGEVLIIKDDYTIFHESFGWFNKEQNKKMEKGAIYHTSSMSKPFSTTLILQLSEKGILSLDEPAQKFIYNFPNDSVTIRNLMNHTSGYTGWGPDGVNHENIGQYKNLSDWITSWTSMGPNIPVGVHHYTNYNNAALMLIAEVATGKPAKLLTEENILNPLNLSNTHVYPLNESVNEKIPPLYRWSSVKKAYDKIDNFEALNWPAYAGSFGIFSTAEDYALFMKFWMNRGSYGGHKLLAEESINQAFSNSNPNIVESDTTKKYGLGWRFTPSKFSNMPLEFNHGGIMRSYAVAFPSENVIVIYATHSWKRRSHREAFINLIWQIGLFDLQPSPNHVRVKDNNVKFMKLDDKEAKKYIGTYIGEYADGFSINVKIRYEYGQLVNRIEYSDLSLPDINYLSFVDSTTAHSTIIHNQESIWFNPNNRIRFLEKEGLITGFKVMLNNELEIELLKINDSH